MEAKWPRFRQAPFSPLTLVACKAQQSGVLRGWEKEIIAGVLNRWGVQGAACTSKQGTLLPTSAQRLAYASAWFSSIPYPQLEEGGRILCNPFPRAAAGRLVQEPTQSKKVTQVLTQAPVPGQGGQKGEKGAGKPAGSCSARTAAEFLKPGAISACPTWPLGLK